MSKLNSPEYYERREQQERELAAACADLAVKEIHLQMAEEYARLANGDADLSRPSMRIDEDR